jgi:hypothetical protein
LQLAQVPAEQFGYLRGGLEAVRRIFGVQPGDERFQPGGHVGVELAGRPGRVLADALHHRHHAAGTKRRPPGAERVQDAAQAEQVGAVVHGAAVGLLRRHVIGGASDDAALCQAGVLHRAGQAEVSDLDAPAALGQQDVGRLDVAVDQPLFVGGVQTGGDLQADAQHLPDRRRPVPFEMAFERGTVDELHDQVRHGPGVLDGVNADNVVVADRGGDPGLADEALVGRVAVGQVRGQHLDGDDTLQPLVERLEDDAHAALADDSQHLVMAKPAERARFPRRGQEFQRLPAVAGLPNDRILQEGGRHFGGVEQGLDPLAQHRVAGADLVQVGCPFGRVVPVQGGNDNVTLGHGYLGPGIQ